MIVLQGVNPNAVAFILQNILPEQAPQYMEVFAEALTRTGQNPALYYSQARVSADADPAAIQANAASTVSAAFPAGDWAQMLHPTVLAQTMVDLAERQGLPLVDGLFVHQGDWNRLTDIQPSAAARVQPVAAPAPAAPAPAPVAAPVVAPVQPGIVPAELADPANPYPQPTPISTTQYEHPPQSIQLAPDTAIEDAQFVDQSPAQTGSLQPASNVVQLQPAAAPVAAQAAPEISQAQTTGPVGTGAYGLPAPTMAASKGASPFDKDPSGDPPKTPPARQLRDMLDMAPHLFAAPAGDVVGKGNGSAQRLRMYTATLLFVDRLLASVPDQACPVGYLRYQIEHLRYHASQTPAANTMLHHEQWLFAPETK